MDSRKVGLYSQGRRPFNLEYFEEILKMFLNNNFHSMTHLEFYRNKFRSSEDKKQLLLRFDVDAMPERIPGLLRILSKHQIVATFYWQIHASFNPFFHENYKILQDLIAQGHEVGLHSNFLEFAIYFEEEPVDIIRREKEFLESVINAPVLGHSCHREVNYEYNSLPLFDSMGAEKLGFEYSAYNPIFNSETTIYVNEGLSPHLGWRGATPEDASETDKNVTMLLHPHWWHERFHVGL